MNGQNRDSRREGRQNQPREAQKNTNQPNFDPKPAPQPTRPAPDCPICGKPVTDLFSAIAYKENSEPAHFECIVKWLSDAEKLAEDEKLVYLGGGVFGVVPANFVQGQKLAVKRMIQYENKEKKPDWRKELSSRYASR
jgi:NAD-dependent SIR2 family protein deacetylase